MCLVLLSNTGFIVRYSRCPCTRLCGGCGGRRGAGAAGRGGLAGQRASGGGAVPYSAAREGLLTASGAVL